MPGLLAVDIGNSGAAALIRFSRHTEPELLAMLAWQQVSKTSPGGPFMLVDIPSGEAPVVSRVDSFHGIGVYATRRMYREFGSPWYALCEGVQVQRNAKTALRLNEMAGFLMGPTSRHSIGGVRRPTASAWRAKILAGIDTRNRVDAKAASLKHIPPMLDGVGYALNRACGALNAHPQDLDHITDAAGIGLFGVRLALSEMQDD